MKPLVGVEELRKLMPQLSLGRATQYAPMLSAAMEEQDITTKQRRCAFLAQLAHESVQLRYMEEIASGAAYEGRTDLGNTHPGDGKRYKGRGPIQLTGRSNYRRFGRLLGLDLEGEPTLAAKPENGFRIAALFWKLGGLNDLADKLTLKKNDANDKIVFARITRIINGGHNGLQDRYNYFTTAKQVIHEDDDPSSPSPAPVAPPTALPAESVAEQEAASQVDSPAEVSADTDVDLLGAAVKSDKAKQVGLKLWPRLVKHSGAGLTWLYAFYEANKFGFFIVAVVLLAGVAWLIYHNRDWIRTQLLKALK